jgi:hypothetical protein
MRLVPIPNNNSPNEHGVELDKVLSDGSKALGIVRITSQPSPYKSGDTLLTIEAWQVDKNGRPLTRQPLSGQAQRVGIRQMIVVVPQGEYLQDTEDKQISIAAAALALEAGDPPAPVSLPNRAQVVESEPVSAQIPTPPKNPAK